MNEIRALKNSMDAVCIYGVMKDPVMRALYKLLEASGGEEMIRRWAEFFHILCGCGCTDSLKSYVSRLVLADDNLFTKSAAAGIQLSGTVIDTVKNDLRMIQAVSETDCQKLLESAPDAEVKKILSQMGKWACGESAAPLSGSWEENLDVLSAYHCANGYGEYTRYRAFIWRERRIFPVASSNPITLADLKSYEKQRQKVVDNTESFVMGLPANNVLLYGDRGTGKSSTVHAVLNHFAAQGLRLIEVPKSAICEFPLLLEQLVDSPMKFLIFIDDLSFESDDASYAQLKAVLEGSVSARQNNTLIYATSNIRHLIKETFSSRQGDEIHRNDTIQEAMSLSDRFGLSVTFSNPDKSRYFEILDKIAADRGLCIDLEKLHSGAERFALYRGGRSPRVARQYIDSVESKIKRSMEWD